MPGDTANYAGCSDSALSPVFNSLRIDLTPNHRGSKMTDASVGVSPATRSVRTTDSTTDSSAFCKSAELTVTGLLDITRKCGPVPRAVGTASSSLLAKGENLRLLRDFLISANYSILREKDFYAVIIRWGSNFYFPYLFRV